MIGESEDMMGYVEEKLKRADEVWAAKEAVLMLRVANG